MGFLHTNIMSEQPTNQPAPSAPEQQPDLLQQGIQKLRELHTAVDEKVEADIQAKTRELKEWFEASKNSLTQKTGSSLDSIKREMESLKPKLDTLQPSSKEALSETLDTIQSTISSITTATRSQLQEVFNSVKEEGLNFMQNVRENGFMAAVQEQGGDLIAGGMRLFDALKNTAAFTMGPLLKMIGLEDMVGGDRVLLANALKREKVKGIGPDINFEEATFEYVTDQYDAHFLVGGDFGMPKPEFFKKLVERLKTDVVKGALQKTVTYKQLNDAVDLMVKDKEAEAEKRLKEEPKSESSPGEASSDNSVQIA